MKRWLPFALVFAFGCDNVDPGLLFLKYVRPDDDCFVTPDDASAIFYTYDPFFLGDLDVFPVFRNDMVPPRQIFNAELGLNVIPPTQVTVTDFEHVFQCDESVFAGAGQMFLPIFGASNVSFCQDPRNTDAAFQAFDVRPVDGSTIDPAGTQAIGVKVVSGELGRGFEEMFVLAVAADVCCSSLAEDLCGQGRVNELPPTAECNQIRNAVIEGRLPATEIQTIRQYAKFDVTHQDAQGNSLWIGSPYSLRVRGNYIGTTAGGNTMTSNTADLILLLSGRNLEQQYLNGGQDERDALRSAFICSSEILLE